MPPSDGTVLHYGRVIDGLVEQVKGVTYPLEKFLGSRLAMNKPAARNGHLATTSPGLRNGNQTLEVNLRTGPRQSKHSPSEDSPVNGNHLYYIIIYLGLGDYHHFHSPANWTVQMRRHIAGELLTVQPWAAHLMPGLFALNERAILSGHWEHGFFSLTAVGAYNVGSIQLDFDKDLKTNLEEQDENERDRTREFSEDTSSDSDSRETPAFRKGDHLGRFNLGSSVVLVFEAPVDLQVVVEPGKKVLYGQAIGRFDSQPHMESDTE